METKWKYSYAFLVLFAMVVWLAVYYYPKDNLRLIACDVGQGDAILAIYGKTQFLIDGGPSDKVLDCLSSYMPFWDRNIEVVILTHPDKDHFSGLIEVFKRYEVNYFVANSLEPGSQGYQLLKKVVGGSDAVVIPPKEGMVIGNSMMHLEIIFPTDKFQKENLTYDTNANNSKVLGTSTTSMSANNFSIVTRLESGEFRALLTGDIVPSMTDEVINTGKVGKVDYIKVPHHGSKNGLTEDLLKEAKPEIAVISVGKNQWGHPHKEILEMLNKYSVKTLRTDQMGDIKVEINNGKMSIM